MNNTDYTDTQDDKLYSLIKNSIDEWKDTQLNISSETGREALAKAVHDQVNIHVKQLIEDIVCPHIPWD